MTAAKYSEIRDLIKRGRFQAVLRTELPDSANMITARYLLAIKSSEDKEERYKARYAAGRHPGIMQEYLVLCAKIIQSFSVRITLVVANVKGLRIWVVDVKLAYLYSEKSRIRKIFIRSSAPEFELRPE